MKLAIAPLVFCFAGLVVCDPVLCDEAAPDCEEAREAFVSAVEEKPEEFLAIFIDALRKDPQCRRGLLMVAAEAAAEDGALLERVIYAARGEFPDDASSMAEAVLLAAPGSSELVREAFFASEETRQSALALAARSQHPGLVALPAEAALIDEDIRDAIARIAAKVEGKLWLEQDLEPEEFRFRQPDEVRVPRRSRLVDESSLENGLPVVLPEFVLPPAGEVSIDDFRRPSDSIRLDESRFAAAAPEGVDHDGREEPEAVGRDAEDAGGGTLRAAELLEVTAEEWAPAGLVGEIQMGAQVAGEEFVPLEAAGADFPVSGEDAFLQFKLDSLLSAPQD